MISIIFFKETSGGPNRTLRGQLQLAGPTLGRPDLQYSFFKTS